MSFCGVAASADGVGHSGLVLYVNGEYRDDSDIGKLMHDFNCTSADDMNADDMNFEILAEKTRYLKENPKGVSEMCKVMEDLRDESYAEGHAEGREEQAQMTAKNLYEQGLTIEQIARAIGLTGETVETAVHLHAGVFIPVEGTAHHTVPVYGEAVQLRSLSGRDSVLYVRKDRGATLRPNGWGTGERTKPGEGRG